MCAVRLVNKAILETPVKYLMVTSTIAAFKENNTYLTKRRFNSVNNIIKNIASKAIKKYLGGQNNIIQLLEQHNHWVNELERAIQTFKNHRITGISTCDETFPSVLSCKLIKQANDKLSVLRTSRTHPQLSEYHVFEGPHYFNQVPFAPPGCCATIFKPPETQTRLVTRAINAWYFRPAYEHYRAWKFHISSTGRYKTSAQANF